MNQTDLDPTRFPKPWHFGVAAVLFSLLVAYGSFIPLEFKAISLDQALEKFAHIPFYHLGVYKRQDLVANLLIYVPVGFLWAGSIAGFCRRGAILTAAAVGFISLIQLTTVVGVEFAQLWFPRRTVSLNDMLAEATGCLLGMVIGFVFQGRFRRWAQQLVSRATNDADLFVLVLYTYLLGLVLYQMLPFDLVLSPEEIRRKFADGRVLLNPFSSPGGDFFYGLWQVVADAMLFVPVGLLARIGPDARRPMRSSGRAAAWVIGLAAAIEFIQLFIFSRYCALQDVITSSLGGAAGLALAGPLSRLRDDPDKRQRLAEKTRQPGFMVPVGLFYVAMLLGYFWYPFDFVADPAWFGQKLRGFFDVPFAKYYVGTEQNAAANLMRATMLFVPVGFLVRWATGDQAGRWASRWLPVVWISCLLGVLIEVGQAAMQSRYSDLTDVLVYTVGAVGGGVLAHKIQARLRVTHTNLEKWPGGPG